MGGTLAGAQVGDGDGDGGASAWCASTLQPANAFCNAPGLATSRG